MNITDVRIRKVVSSGKLKAVASVTFDDEFVVHDMKIIQGQNGLFIAMPSRKTPDGEYKDIAHPTCQDTREKIASEVLRRYQELEEESQAQGMEGLAEPAGVLD